MSFSGLETFAADNGQFSTTHFSSDGQVALSFVSNTGVSAYPTSGFSSSMYLRTDAIGVNPPPSSYVAVDFVSEVVPFPLPLYLTTNPGFYKDGANFVFADTGLSNFAAPTTTYVCAITICIAGNKIFLTADTTFNSAVPYRKALAINGKIVEFWVFTSTGWQLIQSVDASSVYDFTAPGALTGWKAGFSVWCNQGPYSSTVANLQWGPRSELLGNSFFPPQNVGAVILPGPAVQLDWSAAVPFPGNPLLAPDGYLIIRDGVQVGHVTTAGVTEFIDSTISSGPTYVYTIEACNSAGTAVSAPSDPLTVSTTPVSAYGKFVGSAVYPAVEISRVGDIIPRIWPSKKNITVYG